VNRDNPFRVFAAQHLAQALRILESISCAQQFSLGFVDVTLLTHDSPTFCCLINPYNEGLAVMSTLLATALQELPDIFCCQQPVID
jgi:hypothetical protein